MSKFIWVNKSKDDVMLYPDVARCIDVIKSSIKDFDKIFSIKVLNASPENKGTVILAEHIREASEEDIEWDCEMLCSKFEDIYLGLDYFSFGEVVESGVLFNFEEDVYATFWDDVLLSKLVNTGYPVDFDAPLNKVKDMVSKVLSVYLKDRGITKVSKGDLTIRKGENYLVYHLKCVDKNTAVKLATDFGDFLYSDTLESTFSGDPLKDLFMSFRDTMEDKFFDRFGFVNDNGEVTLTGCVFTK